MKAETIKLMIRMPPELHGKVKNAAKSNFRSLNKELVVRLTASFDAHDLVQIVRDAVRAEMGRKTSWFGR